MRHPWPPLVCHLVPLVFGACSDDSRTGADTSADSAPDSATDTRDGAEVADAAPDQGDANDDDASRTALESALHASAAALCERAPACLPFLLGTRFGGDVAACTAREYETLLPILDMPGVESSAADYLALADFVAHADCDVVRRGVLASDLPVAARLHGALADGAACAHPFQCASGACSRTFEEPCGTCVTPHDDGTACTLSFDCAPGSACVDGTCTPFGEPPDACDDTHPCYPFYACLDGHCAAPLGVDAPCEAPVGECDLDAGLLVCGLAKACQPITWGEVGDDCGYRGDAAIVCAASDCMPSVFIGTCTAFADDGDACDTANGPLCDFHAACIDGVCVPYYGATCE